MGSARRPSAGGNALLRRPKARCRVDRGGRRHRALSPKGGSSQLRGRPAPLQAHYGPRSMAPSAAWHECQTPGERRGDKTSPRSSPEPSSPSASPAASPSEGLDSGAEEGDGAEGSIAREGPPQQFNGAHSQCSPPSRGVHPGGVASGAGLGIRSAGTWRARLSITRVVRQAERLEHSILVLDVHADVCRCAFSPGRVVPSQIGTCTAQHRA